MNDGAKAPLPFLTTTPLRRGCSFVGENPGQCSAGAGRFHQRQERAQGVRLSAQLRPRGQGQSEPVPVGTDAGDGHNRRKVGVADSNEFCFYYLVKASTFSIAERFAMAEHPVLSATERLHLEHFLRTSAQYLGLATSEPRVPKRGRLCRKPFHVVRVPAQHVSSYTATQL